MKLYRLLFRSDFMLILVLTSKMDGTYLLSGDNGTIDGQGALWWQQFHKGKLKYTRPYLIEFMYTDNIQISSLTLLNSPSWNVHPVYSRYPICSLDIIILVAVWLISFFFLIS